MKEKLGDARRTKIINHELGKMTDEDVIPEEDAVILMTDENYVKRTSMTDYRRQNRGGKGKRGVITKESDTVAQLSTTSCPSSLIKDESFVCGLSTYRQPAYKPKARRW